MFSVAFVEASLFNFHRKYSGYKGYYFSEFEDQRSRFFAEHERFDDFMEMREGLDLIGVSSFKEYMVAYRY